MSWNIRYFHFDRFTAGLSWDGTTMSLPAGSYTIEGEFGGAEFGDLDFNGSQYSVSLGVSTLTGPDGDPKTIVAAASWFSVDFQLGGEGIPVSGLDNLVTAFLLSDETVVFVQVLSTEGLSGILPDTLVVTSNRTVGNTSYSFSDWYFTGSFGGQDGMTCFTAGTLIATLRGPVPVEAIRPGDLVLTRDRGYRPVCWAGQTRVSGRRLALAERLRPIRIAAGALGPGMPARDLLVSPQHRMLLTGPEVERAFCAREVLGAAKHLVGLPGITVDQPAEGVTYVHLLLDTHEVLLADGAWSESLYTGPQAMKMLPAAQRAEILTLFPDLAQGAPAHAAPARRFLTGREMRRLRPALAPAAVPA